MPRQAGGAVLPYARRAEAKWQELDENNQPDRAWHWPELTLCELALEEARRQVGEGTVAARK